MWATSSRRLNVDGAVVRVQGNELAVPVLRDVLGEPLAPDDRREPEATVSIRLEPAVPSGVQPLHAVYVDGCLHVRTRDPKRAIRGVVDVLSASTRRADGVVLEGCAVVDDTGAVVLPVGTRSHLLPLERRLNRAGLRLVDAPHVLIDAADAHLVVDEPTPVPGSTLDGVYAGDEYGPAPAGRWRVRAWVLDELTSANDPRRQPGIELVRNIEQLRSWRARAVLTRVELGAYLRRSWDPWPDDLVAAVVALATGAR